uniref:Interleukin-18 n=1 Tax=Mus spicilegus TaxID=10103 RepID=A0A8C6GKH3_MUSSI
MHGRLCFGPNMVSWRSWTWWGFSVVPCFLYSCLLAPAADRTDIFCNLQHQEKESRLKSSKSLPLGPGTMAAMSEDSCVNFKEMMFIDNTLYFIPEENGDLESDNFGRLHCTTAVIRNINDQVLFVDKRQPVFEDMTDIDRSASEPQTRLIIYMYKDSEVRGLAVTLSVKDSKMSTLSCKNKIISFEEMDPPENIDDIQSDLIFFQKRVPGHNKMEFESSLYEGHFLACQKEDDAFKLILKKKDENGDKSVMFTLTNLHQS